MKKICFLTDSIFSYGGVQRVTAVMAKALARKYDVTIVTFDRPEQKNTGMYGLEEADIAYRFFRWPRVGRLETLCCKAYSAVYKKCQLQSQWSSDLYALSSFPSPMRRALAHELACGAYDAIIGVHAPLATRLSTLRPHLKGIRLLGWVHNSFEALFGDTSLYIGAERKRHYVYQFRKLDATVLLCHHDAETYRTYDPKLKTTVIYNPLTLKPGHPSQGTSKKFLAVGRFSHLHKGFDLLIEAFRLFRKQDKEWTLDIVGEGPEEAMYREMIGRYGLDGTVRLHPFTNEIQHYYSEAQVYVLSSRWEGFGLVLVEAMAHGLPVVSSDLPTSQEIMGDFGLYFENGNVEDLARRLHEATLLDWPQKQREAFAIAERFSLEKITNEWTKLIEGRDAP